MTQELSNLCEFLKKRHPEPVIRIHVASNIWAELEEWLGTLRTENPKFSLSDIPIVVDAHYGRGWWSEHYRDRVLLHTPDMEVGLPEFHGFAVDRFREAKDPAFVVKRLDALDGLFGETVE